MHDRPTPPRRRILKRREFLHIFRGDRGHDRRPPVPADPLPDAPPVTDWRDFSHTFPIGHRRHFVIEGARVAIGPDRIVVRADRALELREPRTWTAEGMRHLHFFYRPWSNGLAGEAETEPDHPGDTSHPGTSVRLPAGERWTVSLVQGKDPS